MIIRKKTQLSTVICKYPDDSFTILVFAHKSSLLGKKSRLKRVREKVKSDRELDDLIKKYTETHQSANRQINDIARRRTAALSLLESFDKRQ